MASATVLAMGPAMSMVVAMGMMPFPGSEPQPGLKPVTPCSVTQPTMEKQVSVPTADVGLAQLAMHSCYETAAVKDLAYLEKAMTAYYGMTLEAAGDGSWQMK